MLRQWLGVSSSTLRVKLHWVDDNLIAAHPDPLLLKGEAAMRAINYLYGRGELFYDEFPHVRAILANQEERRRNGLHGNVLGSLRRVSPFYRKGMMRN